MISIHPIRAWGCFRFCRKCHHCCVRKSPFSYQVQTTAMLGWTFCTEICLIFHTSLWWRPQAPADAGGSENPLLDHFLLGASEPQWIGSPLHFTHQWLHHQNIQPTLKCHSLGTFLFDSTNESKSSLNSCYKPIKILPTPTLFFLLVAWLQGSLLFA